ncbi:hypothetical protein [Kribbella steppae]|uniref:hypothetical protein n=1 Tax=Kribbella steppae TaxID=2512223 RepID=UPI00104ABE19|nr:hypothetical protein [Kribbella steppae]
MSAASVPPTRSRLDAIVVPAARASLQRVISLSAELSVPLVLLCSRQARIDKVAERVGATFGARALIVEVPDDYPQPYDAQRTSDRKFRSLSADRSSDLSVKRNIGLLLARLRGWTKILFIDDDISQIRGQDIARLTGHLDRHPVAAMTSRYFPDNSVVCHARRLAGYRQDVFVSGAVLGVNTQHPALSFFPDIYNEDWFFFARHAAGRSLPKIGEVRQDAYEPFADPERAGREELGDLLAEGLYAMFESTPGWKFSEQLAAAGTGHWRDFKEDRLRMIDATKKALEHAQTATGSVDYPTMLRALESLRFAEKHLSAIDPDVCVEFIDGWREDERCWQKMMSDLPTTLGERDALAELGLKTWISCGYGSAGPQSDSPGYKVLSLNRTSARPEASARGWLSPVGSKPNRS